MKLGVTQRQQSGKFVFLTDETIDALKVDELKIELDKRNLSKAGKKAELRDGSKKAMSDKLAFVDVKKFSNGPFGFDQGCGWRLLETSGAGEEPVCDNKSLLDPSASKYESILSNFDEQQK